MNNIIFVLAEKYPILYNYFTLTVSNQKDALLIFEAAYIERTS